MSTQVLKQSITLTSPVRTMATLF